MKSTNRPLPLVDPSEITPTEILDLKTIVRGEHRPNDSRVSQQNANVPTQPNQNIPNGLILPKNSHVARSNSLRSSSPPGMRRGEYRSQANVPPSVPEETGSGPQYPSLRRDPYGSKPSRESPAEWGGQNPGQGQGQNQVQQHQPDNGNYHHHQPQQMQQMPPHSQGGQDNSLLQAHYQNTMMRNSPASVGAEDTGSGKLRAAGSQQTLSNQNQNFAPPHHNPAHQNPAHGSSTGLNGNLLSPRMLPTGNSLDYVLLIVNFDEWVDMLGLWLSSYFYLKQKIKIYSKTFPVIIALACCGVQTRWSVTH